MRKERLFNQIQGRAAAPTQLERSVSTLTVNHEPHFGRHIGAPRASILLSHVGGRMHDLKAARSKPRNCPTARWKLLPQASANRTAPNNNWYHSAMAGNTATYFVSCFLMLLHAFAMKKFSTYILAVALLFGSLTLTCARAQSNWLTLVGDPLEKNANYIQFNPSAMTRDDDVRNIPVRVSGALSRTSQDGIAYRSFGGIATINCKMRSMHFLRGPFYAEPNFKGMPVQLRESAPIDAMTFPGLEGDRITRLIRATCPAVPAK